jgi:hypothetical protein
MAWDNERNSKPEKPGNYQAAIMDLPDREISANQARQKETDPSNELDDLVSDLLKQAPIGTEKPVNTKAGSFEEAVKLLMEFASREE